MKLTLTILLVITLTNICMAQTEKQLSVRVNGENLFSTHDNNFPGASASVNMHLNKRWELGLGIEYTASPYHDDNGWNLYKLRFVPVFLSQRFNILTSGKWIPYIHLQEGLTFTKYDKEFQDNLGPRELIKEKGFYGYAGVGVNYLFSNRSGVFAEVGMKSFQLSTNNLDVNPHGVNGRIGYCFKLCK